MQLMVADPKTGEAFETTGEIMAGGVLHVDALTAEGAASISAARATQLAPWSRR